MGYEVGAAVIGAVAGAAGTAFAAAGIGAIVASVIGYAIIGAAIGGLTAAITGGDIGKGVLWGAVGGAVTGGISGYFAGAGSVVAGAMEGSQLYGWEAAQVSSNAATSTYGAGATAAASQTKDGGSFFGSLAKDGTSSVLSGLGPSLVNMAGTTAQGSALEDMKTKEMEAQEKQLQADRELRERLAQLNASTTMGAAEMHESGAMERARLQYKSQREQLDEQTRQYNVNNQLKEEQRQRQSSAVGSAVAARKGVLQGKPPSIDAMVAQQQQQVNTQYPQVPKPEEAVA